MYCVKFCDRLRGKFGDVLQKATKRTKVFAAAEDKAFVSFVVFCLESSPVHPLYEKTDKLSRKVIGAAIEVHRHRGPGLIESIYERCLLRELELRSRNDTKIGSGGIQGPCLR
jgi:hypothetical protein